MKRTYVIPNKSHFKAQEVCAITDIRPYVLRFWESEFDELAPATSGVGVKLFGHKDIEVILVIKRLLFEEKMTVEQVKREFFIDPSLLAGPNDSAKEGTQALHKEEGGEEFSPLEIEKLLAAKSKLQNILNLTDQFYRG